MRSAGKPVRDVLAIYFHAARRPARVQVLLVLRASQGTRPNKERYEYVNVNIDEYEHNAQSSRLTGDPPALAPTCYQFKELVQVLVYSVDCGRLRQRPPAVMRSGNMSQRIQRPKRYPVLRNPVRGCCSTRHFASRSMYLQRHHEPFTGHPVQCSDLPLCVSSRLSLSFFPLAATAPSSSIFSPSSCFFLFPSLFLFPFPLSPALFLILPFSLSFSCRTSSRRFETFALSSLSSDHP